MCEGEKNVTFLNANPNQDYFSYEYSDNILTVTVEEAGGRTGGELEGGIYIFVNGGPPCKTIIFKQNPAPPCDCNDLMITLQS